MYIYMFNVKQFLNSTALNCAAAGSQATKDQEVDDEKEGTKEEKREDKTASDQDNTKLVEE